MEALSDEQMGEMLAQSKAYSVVILRPGPHRQDPGADGIVWEHGRRNFALRAAGLLAIVCPIPGGGEAAGVAIFNAPAEQVRELMDDDPGVRAGVFVYELYTGRSFPGDRLP